MAGIHEWTRVLGTTIPAIAFVLTGCGTDMATSETARGGADSAHHAPAHHQESDDARSGDDEGAMDVVTMTPEEIAEAGVVVEPVVAGRLTSTTTIPGRVVPTQSGMARVGTVISGRVKRLLVAEGSRVGRGQALAEIEAYDVGVIKGELLHARADAEQRRAALARAERLGSEGIGAERTIEEARSAFAQAIAQQKSAEARLRAIGVNPNRVTSDNFGAFVILRSPIAGIVSRRNVALGEFLEPSHDAFEIVETSVVWIDAQASPALASMVAVGNPAFVAYNNHRQSGRVIFISPAVDPRSRTVTVRVEIDNTRIELQHDAYVTVEFERLAGGTGLVVPRRAIESEGADRFVYLEQRPLTFKRVLVDLGQESGDHVVVSAGLSAKSRIAVDGVFYLRAARLKGELAEHDH